MPGPQKKRGIGIPDISVVTGMPPKGGDGFTIYFLAGQVFWEIFIMDVEGSWDILGDEWMINGWPH